MTVPIVQPPFDKRITTLAFPVSGGQSGTIQRGFMVWDQPIAGYSSTAQVQFLYNPSYVTADYSMSNSSVAAAYLFPTGFNQTELRVPLNQTVEWSLLFDRTYELWGSYDSQALPLANNNANRNNPAVVGVLADIMAMQQFTGMFVAYSTGNTKTTKPSPGNLTGWQGIMQLIPSYVYFGGNNSATNSLWYHGYVSEWDVTITHWTQYMVPMRCVMNITFTMIPPPTTSSGTQQTIANGPGGHGGPPVGSTIPGVSATTTTAGVSGR